MLFRNYNREKGGFIFRKPRGADVAREADVARGTRDGCDAACKATWQSHASPRGARWLGHVAKATRVHADARVAPRGRGNGR